MKKRYLGGFRNKKTGIVYLNASTQTKKETREQELSDSKVERFTRETQTAITSTRSQQTTRESGTQMDRKDLYTSNAGDRVVTPLPYFSAAMLAKLKLQKTIIIQCYYRGYKARQKALSMRNAMLERLQRLKIAEQERKKMEEEKHKKEIARRMHPRSFDDFEVLYNELESWRQHETARIKTTVTEKEAQVKALAQLLRKETQLLQTIDRLKITASKENRSVRIKKMLELMSSPKLWQMGDGEVAEIHTPFTTRAKELYELYQGLNLPLLTIDERLDVLLHVKWTVKEFDCNLTRDIVDLIDREADLLNRGRPEKSLKQLRKRISNLFLQFIETPEFNPEAARFQRVPRDLVDRPFVQPIPKGK